MNHIPVLLNEVIKFLDPKPGNIILDATVDGGGHAIEIAEKILPNGKLIGIEQDEEILGSLASNLEARLPSQNIILINGNFRDIDKLLEPFQPEANPPSAENIKFLDGVLYDLGMSSLQLEESGRGFTFLKDEPLLMTYKFPIQPGDLTAKEILNTWPKKEIADILFHYGEERYSRRIARNIVGRRAKEPFQGTFELAALVKQSVPYRPFHRIHPATKTFQALRISVNDELKAISESLEKAWQFMIPGSRLVIISFHSLEDRIAKNFLKNKKQEGEADIKTSKPITASEEEISLNPRSRSAKLRAAVKK